MPIDYSAGNNQPRDNGQAPLYGAAAIVNSYDLEQGVCVLPLAEEPPSSNEELKNWSPVVVLRLHAPYRIRNVAFHQEKQNNPPVMPSPADSGNFVFLGGTLTVVPVPNNAQVFDWTGSAEYQFVENNVSRVEDGFLLGQPPFQYQAVADAAYSSGIAPQPEVGAAAKGGPEVLIGLAQANSILFDTGLPTFGWGYTVASFFPGKFFSTSMVNSGPAPVNA